ncbi:MAG TPA: VCBS repeat-containing protein [Steroidobacteraceae bacterium]|nr:VCBS repeat-containing protein [Steroidobacteraceae bacterium]
MSFSTHLSTARSYRALFAIALLPLLASCNDGYDNYCYNCYAMPAEISRGLVAGDFNAGGFPSIIATSALEPDQGQALDNLKVYLSTAAGAYAAPVYVADGFDPLYLASADLNGDGLADVVSASFSTGTLAVFLNDKSSPGTLSAPLVLSSPGASQVAIGDMNGDGMPDLISADYGVSLFVQTSPGAFAAPISLYSGGANWVAVGDLNGDGAPDVVLTDIVGVKILLHTGAASSTTFAAPVSVFTQTPNANVAGANIVAIADVNNDGANDLVITDPGPTGGTAPTVNILLQVSPGTFAAPVSYAITAGDLPQSIVVTDVDGDGRPDIIIGGRQSVTVLLQNHAPAAAGTFMAATSYAAQGAYQIAVADINGDHNPDIVVGNGVTNPVVNGVQTTHPGVLLQSATSPGTFGAVQDLP